MENISEKIKAQHHIVSLISAAKEDLDTLIAGLDLHMTTRDLQYCQNQYRMRERRNPTLEELLMLDSLYLRRVRRSEAHGLRTFYTSDSLVAETYADMIAKASHTRREERPYTPHELSGVLSRSLQQAGRKISVPFLAVGQDASVQLLKTGTPPKDSVVLNGIPAVIGQQNGYKTSNITPPQATDHLILLSPSGLAPAAFASIVDSLQIPSGAQIITIGDAGLIDALLTLDGAYIVQNYLPAIDADAPLSVLVDAFTDSILIRVDGDRALALRDAAASAGLTASIIGKYAINHRLTIRRDGQTPIQIETAFLRAFSPILPADVEIPGACTAESCLGTDKEKQTVIPCGDCALFSSAIPGTPYAVSDRYLLTGAASFPCANSFRSALFTTIHAVNRAVAAGADYNDVTLSNHFTCSQASDRSTATGDMMATLLGEYRVQAELALPDAGSKFKASSHGLSQTQLTVFAAAPKPKRTVSHMFSAAGNNVYLLSPLSAENSPIDFEDYRKLLRYVHHLCESGVAQSAIAVDASGVEAAVQLMTQGGYGFTTAMALPPSACGFLIETTQVIQGMMIGVTTATPTVQIGEKEVPITSYRRPIVPNDRIPMSDVGVAHPIICVPQTRALGNISPIGVLAAEHQAVLQTMPINRLHSRTQLTALANAMSNANITVLVGTGEEIETILGNHRVAFAKQTALSHGGILLCLYTDLQTVKNQPIPKDHPLFFGVSSVLYERSGISFEGTDARTVHMRADSAAIPQMLTCAIAYYQ